MATNVVLDVKQVLKLEQAIAQGGTSLYELMHRAGFAVADVAVEYLARYESDADAPWTVKPSVLIFAGSGNNGGDGWVAAVKIAEQGWPVALFTPRAAQDLSAEPAQSAACDALARLKEEPTLPLTIYIAPDKSRIETLLAEARVVIDGMLGTGFSGDSVREPYASWIQAAHARRTQQPTCTSISIDVPSGLSAQTGDAANPCFQADETVTMLTLKPGLLAADAQPFIGNLRCAELIDISPYLQD